MKQHIRRHFILGFLIITALASIVPSQVFAVAGSVRFDQSGGQIITGTEFSLDVIGQVPGPATWPFYGGGTTMIVTYDASKLQEIGHNDTGGVFASGSKNWNGTTNGTVKYQSTIAINAPAVNNKKIITIKFKAIATGSTTISFGSGTEVHDGPTSTTPATFTLIAPTCPAGQIGTPPNCTTPPPPAPPSTPKPSATPKPSVKPAPTPAPVVMPTPTVEETPEPVVESDGGLKIENVKITTKRQDAVVTWTLNKAEATPTVSYGLNKGSQKLEAKVTKQDDGSYEATFESLKPGTMYYFSVKASTPDNLQGATYGGTLTTRGYPVQLTVQQNGVLAPGAKVTIGTRSFFANKNAIISTELGDGKFDAQVIPSGSTKAYPATFTVAKKAIPVSGNPELQSFVLDVKVDGANATGSGDSLPLIVGGILATIAGIGGLFGFLLYRRKKSLQNDTSSGVDGDLLAANYGALDNYTSNTPAPNLDAGLGSIALAAQDQPMDESYVSQTDDGQIAADPAMMAPYQDQSDIADSQLLPEQNFETTGLPLPPAPQPADQSYYQADGAPMPPPLTEQQLYQSAELAQVESESVAETSSIDPDEPSAVYDEETGELDIIHHHAATPSVPNEESAISYEPTAQQPQDEQLSYADMTQQPVPDTSDTSLSDESSGYDQSEQPAAPATAPPLTPPAAAH